MERVTTLCNNELMSNTCLGFSGSAFHERQRTELWVSQFILLVISVFMVPIVW